MLLSGRTLLYLRRYHGWFLIDSHTKVFSRSSQIWLTPLSIQNCGRNARTVFSRRYSFIWVLCDSLESFWIRYCVPWLINAHIALCWVVDTGTMLHLYEWINYLCCRLLYIWSMDCKSLSTPTCGRQIIQDFFDSHLKVAFILFSSDHILVQIL